MDHFAYKGSALYCEGISLRELATQFGTPLYVYSYATLARHFRAFEEALGGVPHVLCYSVKANSNLSILRCFSQLGGGADVVSGGELFRCLNAGIEPRKIVFSGVGKTIPEIEYALRKNILLLSVESQSELMHVSEIAKVLTVKAPIMFRFNPDVDPKTHRHMSTGLKESKFGISGDKLKSLYKQAMCDEHVVPMGLGFHIGSQISTLEPFLKATRCACDMVGQLRREGIPLVYLDCGGGLGVRYISEEPPSVQDYVRAIVSLVHDLKLTIILEPGRSLVGDGGVLLTRVLYVKNTESKTFVIVDAGMNDFVRPILYNAEHWIDPVLKQNVRPTRFDIVGPLCESGDVLAKNREMEMPHEGDLLCIRTAGAYGYSMASQYNSRPRPAEVLVRGEEMNLIRERETFADLIGKERCPSWLENRA